MHRQRFQQGRLEQGWLLLLPQLARSQAPSSHSPAGFVQSRADGGKRGKKKEGYGLQVEKPGGTGVVEGVRFAGRAPPDTSSPFPRLCEHAGASLREPGAPKRSSSSIPRKAGA